MSAWMFDMLLVVVAVLLMAVVIYKLLFSAEEEARREMALRPGPRFDRREAELRERRKQTGVPPDGVERRIGPRR